MPVPTDVALMSFAEKFDRENSSDQGDIKTLQQFTGQNESMIMVQVNAGETFTIQAENHTQYITGPAQVPMMSPNGAIPPIQVPQGYISQVIEDQHGIRKVIVIPEAPACFTDRPVMQPMMSQPTHGMPLPMQHGMHCNYVQQMSAVSMNQQQYSAGDHLHMIHQPSYVQQPEGLASIGIDKHTPTIPQFYQYPHQNMDPDFGRYNKVKERLQRKLHDRRQQQHPDPNKNPSPLSAQSFSPSSSSSYATSPSPNSSPDPSPKILKSPVVAYPDGYVTQAKVHPYHQMPHFLSGQQSPVTYSSNYYRPGNNGYDGNRKTDAENSSRISISDGMSSGSSNGGSPRRGPSALHKQTNLSRDAAQQYRPDAAQHDATFHSSDAHVPYPTRNESKQNLKEYLSAITKPEVSDISPRRVCVKWSMQYSPPADSGMEKQPIYFEIYLMHTGKDGNGFKLLSRECSKCVEIKDLKPGVEYQTKVLAEFNSVKGDYSETATFRTKSCTPDTPGAPKMINSTKNSMTLKWMPPNDNGGKILKYYLEWDEGEKGSGFRSLFSDAQRQHRVSKLQPSRNYTFRLSCENVIGISPWSPEVTHKTSGTAPSIPDPPQLSKAFVRSLSLDWSSSVASTNGSSGHHKCFTLEMDDGKGYGFRVVHDGADVRAQIKNLNKSSLYKFRLRAYNNDGKSGYSAAASFLTLPDKPSPPGKVTLKGKAHPTYFKVAWAPPDEDGGSDVTKYVLECAQEKGQQMEPIYSGVDTECLVGNVQPGVTCRLRVFCITNGGTSMPSEVSLITMPSVVPGQCAPPRAASNAASTAIPLRWDPPNYDGGSSITQYEIAMVAGSSAGEISNCKESLEKVYHGLSLDHAVGNLKPGTAYRFALRAANKVGMGQWSDMVELSTSPGPPEKLEAPEPETVTSDSVLLVWKKPHNNGSNITSYSVEWGSEETTMNLQRTSSVLSCNFSRLTPNLTYFFRVQAQNDAGKGPFSDVTSVKTAPSCPDRITSITQGDILPVEKFIEELDMEDDEVNDATFPRPSTSAMVCWDRPPNNGSEITHYILEITHVKSGRRKQTDTEGETFLQEIEGEDCCHLVRNLQPDSEYRVRMKAINEIGSGSFSLPFIIETQPLPPDSPVMECACSYNSLKLKWSDADDNLTYRLQMKEKHGRYATIYNGSGRSFKVNRCSERTTYFFRINAKNDAGDGPFSDVYSFATTTAPPQQLKNLPSVSVKGCCADISWDEVENVKGDTVSSILNIESCGSPALKQTIPLNQNFHRIDQLVPGTKYKIQVALVRLVCTPSVQVEDVATQFEEENSSNQALVPVARQRKQVEPTQTEEIVGQFTNWVTFGVPSPDAMNAASGLGSAGVDESPQTRQTFTQVVKGALARMSDDTMGPVLFMISFFFLAVVVASFVQFLVK